MGPDASQAVLRVAAHTGFLGATGRASFKDLPRLPLHFILMGSMQEAVRAVTGHSGALFSRGNIGVASARGIPLPSLQLLAGMMQLYHRSSYPEMLLRAVATSGRNLQRFYDQPETPPDQLSIAYLQDAVALQGSHLDAVTAVVQNRGTTKGLVASADAGRLAAWEVFDRSPLDSAQLHCVDPQLITITVLEKAGVAGVSESAQDRQRLEQQLEVAEGYVLEVLVRKDLVQSLGARLQLHGAWRL